MTYDDDTLRRLQLAQLGVLEVIDELCKANDIEYFLDSGSALGAVRHKGFIPWDDDIDIGMMRSDYDRFVEVARRELSGDYEIGIPGETAGYAPMFAKIWKRGTKFYTQETMEASFDQGIFVDIFPYDPVFPDEKRRSKQFFRCVLWQRASYLYHAKSVQVPHKGVLGALERTACAIAHHVCRMVLSPSQMARAFDGAAQAAAGIPGIERFAAMAYPLDPPFSAQTLLPTVPCEFEGAVYPVPHDAQTYLKMWYGPSYLELPPVELRTNHAPLVLDFGDGPIGCSETEELRRS